MSQKNITTTQYSYQETPIKSSVQDAIKELLSKPESINYIASKVESNLNSSRSGASNDIQKVPISQVKEALEQVLEEKGQPSTYYSTPTTPKRTVYRSEPKTPVYYATPRRQVLTPSRSSYYYPSSYNYNSYADWDDYPSSLYNSRTSYPYNSSYTSLYPKSYYSDYYGYLDDYVYSPYSRYDVMKRRDYVDYVYDKYLDYKYGVNYGNWGSRYSYYNY